MPMRALGLFVCLALACSTDAPARDASGSRELRVLIPRPALSLDPRFVTDPYGLKISRLIHRGLFRVNASSLEVEADLAREFDFSANGLALTVSMRNARFSDGSSLTATDVVATYDALLDTSIGSPFQGMFSWLDSVERIDEQTVRFVLTRVHATILSDLSFPILSASQARSERGDGRELVGLGKYSLESWSDAQLVLSASEHSERKCGAARLSFVLVRDETSRVLRLRGGGADVALNTVFGENLEALEESESFEIRTAPGTGTTYLGFHTEHVSLSLRRAVAHGIDRTLLIEAELHGRGSLTDTWIPSGHWADRVGPGGEPELGLGFDPERARSLLSREENRRVLLLRTSSDRTRMSLARAIASMLADIGLEVEVRPSEQATLIADLNAGRFDLALLQVPEVVEPNVLTWFFASDRIPDRETLGANRWRLRDEALDAALLRGRSRVEQSERRAAYLEAQERLVEMLPVLPLFQEDNVAVMRRGVEIEVPRDGRFSTLCEARF